MQYYSLVTFVRKFPKKFMKTNFKIAGQNLFSINKYNDEISLKKSKAVTAQC